MSGVHFRYLVPPITKPVISFSTNFPAIGAHFLGDEWYTLLTFTGGEAAVSVDGVVNVSGSGGTFGGGGTVIARTVFIPTPINYSAVVAASLKRTQFSQVTVSAIVGGGGSAVGPMCFGSASGDQCYGLDLNSSSLVGRFIRGVGTSSVNLVDPAMNFALNDVCRLEVDFAAAANTLRCYRNGVLQNTFVDNGALRPLGGVFGIELELAVAGGTLAFSNYSGGFK